MIENDWTKTLAEKDEYIIKSNMDYTYYAESLIKEIKQKDEQITALTKELKSLTEAYNNTDWKKLTDEQKDTIKNLTVRWGKCAAKDRRLREALEKIVNDTLHKKFAIDTATEALRGEEVGDGG